MSDIFFEQLDIPQPHHNLNIAGLSHGAMTGRMLEGIEVLIQKEKPNWVLVYGDTNSTLAGALAAAKLHIPLADVKAGLRAHNPAMPEEINRVLTDRMSNLLLCPTDTAVNNLKQEGFPFQTIGQQMQRIENIGDVMFDAVLYYRERAQAEINLETFGLQHKGYALCTLHRQENTNDVKQLKSIMSALKSIAKDLPVVLPMHPRTKEKIIHHNLGNLLKDIHLLDPVPYLEMQRLQISAQIILTDSGGIQKEAYFNSVPCITLRDETEWTETVEGGWNYLAGTDSNNILKAWHSATVPANHDEQTYGDGRAAEKVVAELLV
jgi:UDP-GlcNAc3NAcA epimerase